MNDGTQRLRALVDEGGRLYGKGDVDGFVDLYTHDAVLVTPDGRYEGIDAIRANWTESMATFTSATVELGPSLEDGDRYFGEFALHATNTGPLHLPDGSQLDATNKTFDLVGSEYAVFRGEKMVEHRMYWDNMAAFAQLGLLPT